MSRAPEGFSSFSPATLSFLKALAENNDRAWFTPRKADYERDVVTPFRALLASLIPALAARDIPLTCDPARSLFRIHRDVRFSADKRPYKTHAGAILTRDGGKGFSGLLYIHVAPEGSFLGSGFYHPEREALGALREAIYTERQRFLDMQAELAAAKLSLGSDESLTRMPRGYEDAADTELSAPLRLKSFVVRRDLTAKQLETPGLVRDIVAFAEHALPLLRFGWSALSVLDPTALTRQK